MSSPAGEATASGVLNATSSGGFSYTRTHIVVACGRT